MTQDFKSEHSLSANIASYSLGEDFQGKKKNILNMPVTQNWRSKLCLTNFSLLHLQVKHCVTVIFHYEPRLQQEKR